MKINLNEYDLDRAIEWTNQRITRTCPYCKRPAKVINQNGEGVLTLDHADWCKYSYLNTKDIKECGK